MIRVTYSTNWMGPINKAWIEEHGDCWSAGRIDIRDDSKEGYAGWSEYSVSPMRSEDWSALSEWLEDVESEEIVDYNFLISTFECAYGKKIRWWKEKE